MRAVRAPDSVPVTTAKREYVTPTAQTLPGPSWKPSNYFSDVWRAEYPTDQEQIEGVRVLVQRANVPVQPKMQYVSWYSIRLAKAGVVLKDFGESWEGERYAATKSEAIETAKVLARRAGAQLTRKRDESALVRGRRERLSGADVKRADALKARREAAKPRALSGAAWNPQEGMREIWRHEYKDTGGARTYRGIVYYRDTPDALNPYAASVGAEVRPGVYEYTATSSAFWRSIGFYDEGTTLAAMQDRIKEYVAARQRMDRTAAAREKMFHEVDRVWDAVGRSDIVARGPSDTHRRTRQAIRRAVREHKVPMALRSDVESQLMVKAEPAIIATMEYGVTPTRGARRMRLVGRR
jgi:hypothetical protein